MAASAPMPRFGGNDNRQRGNRRGGFGGRHTDTYSSRGPYRGGGGPPRPRGPSHNPRFAGTFEKAHGPIPPGTKPISEWKRNFSAWDIRPPEFIQLNAMQAKLTNTFPTPGTGAIAPAAETTVAPNDLEDLFSCRLIVRNLPLGIAPKDVRAFFNQKMRDIVSEQQPVVSADLVSRDTTKFKPKDSLSSADYSTAIIEFRTPDGATAALSTLQNVPYMDKDLTLERPPEYGRQNTHHANSSSTSHTRLFVGGLPTHFQDAQVLALLEPFGRVTFFDLPKSADASKGYAFVEFDSDHAANAALAGLNGSQVADRHIIAQHAASAGANSTGLFLKKAKDLGRPIRVPLLAALYDGTAPRNLVTLHPDAELRNSALRWASLPPATPTHVLQILNMVTAFDLVHDYDYMDILDDVHKAAAEFGPLSSVKIPRPVIAHSGRIDPVLTSKIPHLGKVFLRFESPQVTTKALHGLAGREYNGHFIICAYAPESVILDLDDAGI